MALPTIAPAFFNHPELWNPWVHVRLAMIGASTACIAAAVAFT